ncbi:MAG: GNAT family N-acetyltransferase [Chloroflexota bacterium]
MMREKIAVQSRPYDERYLLEIVNLLNAAQAAINGKPMTNEEEFKAEMQSPGFNPATDARLFFDSQDRLVGYAEFWDRGQPHVRLFCFGAVHPDVWGYGIGTMIVQWVEHRAMDSLPLAPEDAQVVIHSNVHGQNERARRLYQKLGYQVVRTFYRMRIDFDQPPQKPIVPAGFKIRPIQNEADLRLAIFADFDSFKDHWGFVQEGDDFESFYHRLSHYLKNDPFVDLNRSYLAMDGDEVAGVCINSIGRVEDDRQGWVNILGVRRPWRKRGLGLALLLTSFNMFYSLGMTSAGLGVDSANLTGALRLYEQAGMRAEEYFYTFEKEIRPGRCLFNRG